MVRIHSAPGSTPAGTPGRYAGERPYAESRLDRVDRFQSTHPAVGVPLAVYKKYSVRSFLDQRARTVADERAYASYPQREKQATNLSIDVEVPSDDGSE